MRSVLKKTILLLFVFFTLTSAIYAAQVINTRRLENSKAQTVVLDNENGQLATNNDLTIDGILRANGEIYVSLVSGQQNGKVLSVDELGKIILVDDQTGVQEEITNYITQTTTQSIDSPFFVLESDNGDTVGLGLTTPDAKFHIKTEHSGTIGLVVEAENSQTADLAQFRNESGIDVVSITQDGKMILDNNAGHQLEIRPSGDTGYLSSNGGALFLENTYNKGTGIGIFSNAGSEALGNMINVKVDNPAFNQAAFYMNYDGISNAVEIVSNTDDTSSNALAVTNYNNSDSALGIIGYESGRGTIKVSHIKPSATDSSASGISIDLQGTGTAAQGLYVDSTASGGTSGNLLRLRNETVDRFVVGPLGSVSIGGYGTDTSVTKYGNTSGDQFFVGTNGAFRIQRAATDSEAFRTQISGDTQGRWLGTSDGKLKFGDGSAAQDVVLQRTGTGLFQMDTDIQVVSQSTNNDVILVTASDGSRLGRFTETSGGHGWFEVDNSSGTAQVLLRADGGDSYFLTGNLGLGTTTFDSTADKVLTFGNGTAPAASIADGVQLWAEDVTASSELRVRDEAGNVSTLSPHNFSLISTGPSEDMAWAFYSEKEDLAINADITKALRVLEKISGEKLVYIKNIKTGEEIEPNYLDDLKDNDELSASVSSQIDLAVNRQDFEKHVSLIDNVWQFISEITFKSKAFFEDSVQFLADVTFAGHLSVNADTAGNIYVNKGTKRLRVNFSNQYNNAPLVYVSTDYNVSYKIENIDLSGFEVNFENYLPEDIQIRWFALEQNSDSKNYQILESSE